MSKLYKKALWLSYITIGYNLIEGVISTFFGAQDETLALFGFGVDSFVEVISGIGIAHMIFRLTREKDVARHDSFEVTALRITGTAFYILTAGLVVGSILIMVKGIAPETTIVGVIVGILSILTMYFLYDQKIKVGRKLNSEPIIADAKCTKTCLYLSFILLGSSALYELFRIPYFDALGSLGIAWYAFKEGRESFEKARSKNLVCGHNC